jgi:hypothetical protein
MRVRALSKSYFGQSTITELIRHPSSRAPCPQPMIPPGVLPTQGCLDGNHKNVQQRSSLCRSVGDGTLPRADSSWMLRNARSGSQCCCVDID